MANRVLLKVKPSTRKELADLCTKKGETYDQIITRLIKVAKEARQKP